METRFEDLLRRAQDGDAEAMGALLEPHLPALRAFVRLHLENAVARRESTTDVVQSVCGDILVDIRDFRSGNARAFKAWLFTAAAHKLRNKSTFHRAARRDVFRERPTPPDEGDDHAETLVRYSRVVSPSRAAMTRDALVRFETAFDALPRHYRAVIAHVCIAGLSYTDAAVLLDRSEDSVRQLLHRARARLATLLEGAG